MYKQGYNAYFADKHPSRDCPYNDVYRAALWLDGWTDAMKDYWANVGNL